MSASKKAVIPAEAGTHAEFAQSQRYGLRFSMLNMDPGVRRDDVLLQTME